MFDRFTLVLHIFRCNARTREARMQLALAEIPLLRFAGDVPRMSSPRVFTTCPLRESVGDAACSAPHMFSSHVLGYSPYVLPTCPPCVSSRVTVDAATGGRWCSPQFLPACPLHISLDAVTGVLPVSSPPLMRYLPASLQVLCEYRLWAARPARLGLPVHHGVR